MQAAISDMSEHQLVAQDATEARMHAASSAAWEVLESKIVAEKRAAVAREAARVEAARWAGSGPMPPGLPEPAAFVPSEAAAPVAPPGVEVVAEGGLASAT